MRKIVVFLFVIGYLFNIANAEQLVLSDIIQNARDKIIMQEAKEKAELAMTKPMTKQDIESCEKGNKQQEQEKKYIKNTVETDN